MTSFYPSWELFRNARARYGKYDLLIHKNNNFFLFYGKVAHKRPCDRRVWRFEVLSNVSFFQFFFNIGNLPDDI